MQLLTGRDRVGSPHRTIGRSLAISRGMKQGACRKDCRTITSPVGASLLAMVVNDYACLLAKRGALTFIASK
ncbi:hypothetical protein EJA72_29005 [Pseudomonas sp. PB120]|nr:hypothetical protein [Pseudomonas sp. PB120]